MVEWFRSLTPQQLLLLNALIVTLLVMYFWSGKTRKPTRLQMGSGSSGPPSTDNLPPSAHQSIQPKAKGRTGPNRPKSLNVIFMYNQHTFDAYEILGVPAGSSYAVVKEAYDDLMREMPGEKRPLVDAAFQAIQKERSDS